MEKEDKRLIIIVATVFAIGISIAVYVSIKLRMKFEAQKSDLVALRLNGRLVGIKEHVKETSVIVIHDKQTMDTLRFRLEIRSFLEEENIQVNDSISKEANSPMLHFYKRRNQQYVKCCKYEI